ncbi:MAG: DmsE family decaheme c-type cytochrome [Elusimicrobia bacterium]|nr:DmsE family decaheme c-type cytochrome [Elusimicrobiota bacterium]
MHTRSCSRIRRAGLVFAAMTAMLSFTFLTPAFAADKEVIPSVSAPEAKVAANNGDSKMVGQAACATCHAEKAEAFSKTFHGRKSLSNGKLANACESCHGAGSGHADAGDVAKITNPKKLEPAAVAALCLTCHKDKALMMWKTSPHKTNGVSCLTCHSIHEGEGRQSLVKGKTDTCLECHTSQKADMRLPSHHPVAEGKMSCVSCHNPHGGIEGNLKADSGEELCAKCHSEKVGPFAFEHPPVADGCMNCHKPHGSANDKLLKQSPQTLCLSCHVRAHGNITAGATTLANLEPRTRCTNCHRDIHGSNRDSLFAR